MCLAIPGQIVEVFEGGYDSALVDVVGVRRKVDLGLLQDNPPKAGDWVVLMRITLPGGQKLERQMDVNGVR